MQPQPQMVFRLVLKIRNYLQVTIVDIIIICSHELMVQRSLWQKFQISLIVMNIITSPEKKGKLYKMTN